MPYFCSSFINLSFYPLHCVTLDPMHLSSSLIVLGAAFLFGVMAAGEQPTKEQPTVAEVLDANLKKINEFYSQIKPDDAEYIRDSCLDECTAGRYPEGEICYEQCVLEKADAIGYTPPEFEWYLGYPSKSQK